MVQQIWQSTVESCKRTIQQKKNHFSIVQSCEANEISISDDASSSSSSLTTITTVNDETNEVDQEEHIRQEDQLSSTDSLTPIMSILVKARLENIEERARRMLEFMDVRSEY